MVPRGGFRDKLGSARVEGQAFGPREAQKAWGLASHQCLIQREKGPPAEAYPPMVFSCQEGESYHLGRGDAEVRCPP